VPRTRTPYPAAPTNAVTHGLTASAAEILTHNESRQDWQRFHDDVVESLHPEPGAEARLAGRAAELMWRIRRVAVAEAQFVDHDYAKDERAHLRGEWMKDNSRRVREQQVAGPTIDPTLAAPGEQIVEPVDGTSDNVGAPPVRGFHAPVFAAGARYPDPLPLRTIPDAEHTERIIRYEAHLSRQLYLALNQLEAMQNRRAGQASPIARVQVTGLPGS